MGLTAMLPDVMTNVMISYTADGETVYRGIGESGKDGSVFFLELTRSLIKNPLNFYKRNWHFSRLH